MPVLAQGCPGKPVGFLDRQRIMHVVATVLIRGHRHRRRADAE